MSAPTCPQDGTVLTWYEGGWGYRCEHCYLFVTIPKQKPAGVIAPTLARVPNKPKTPLHSFRCPDPLWEAAKAKAAEREENLSDVLRSALERYVKRK